MGDETDTVSSMQSVVVRFAEQLKLSLGDHMLITITDDTVNVFGHIYESTWNEATFTIPVNGPYVIIKEISINLDTPIAFGSFSLEPLLSGQTACCDILNYLLKKNQQSVVNDSLTKGEDNIVVRLPLMRSIDRILPAFDINSRGVRKIISSVSFKFDAYGCL